MQKTIDENGKATVSVTEGEQASAVVRAAEQLTKFKEIVLTYGLPYLEKLIVKTGQKGKDKATAIPVGTFEVRKARTVAEAVAIHGEEFVVASTNATYSRAVGAGVRTRYNRPENPILDEASIKLDMGAYVDDGIGVYDNLDYGTRAGYSRDSVEATLKREIDKLSKALTKASPLEAPELFKELQAKATELFQHKQGKVEAQLEAVPQPVEEVAQPAAQPTKAKGKGKGKRK